MVSDNRSGMEFLDTLRKFVSRYVALCEREIAMLAEAIEIREFGKKELVTREGEVEGYLNLVLKGLSRKYFLKNREEMVTHFAREGEFICCYESFVSGRPSDYIVETIEPTIFLSISCQRLEDLYLASPKMERLGRLVLTEQFIINEHWEFDRVRFDSQERFVRFIRDNADLLQRVPQKYLASYLNIQPETFSRMKHLLRSPK